MRLSTDAPTLWLPGMSPDAPVYQPVTLQSYFSDCFFPAAQAKGLSRDRLGELLLAVHRYKWWSAEKYRIPNPVLRDITASRLAAFRQGCLDQQIPGRDGRLRTCSPRSLNKTLQALEQIVSSAIEDGTLDESRGLIRIRKCQHARQINKLVIPDGALSAILDACRAATWPRKSVCGRSIDTCLMWQTAVVMWATFGMRTQDLIRYESRLVPIRWGCLVPKGQSPAEDGTSESRFGWLHWVPNKTRSRKSFPMTLPLNETVAHWLSRWRDSLRPKDGDPMFPAPLSNDGLYEAWRQILQAADVRPKPKRIFDDQGRVSIVKRNYLIKHLRCTAGTRAEEHGASIGHTGIGRWVTGHISNDVFERHYRGHERALMQVIETLPQPPGFSPRPTLRVVG